MADDAWQMPRCWGFREILVTAEGLLVKDPGPGLVPWRLLRRIRRPGAGRASLLLADGSTLPLPDGTAEADDWLQRIAAAAIAGSAAEPTAADHVATVDFVTSRHGDEHRSPVTVKDLGGLAKGVLLGLGIAGVGYSDQEPWVCVFGVVVVALSALWFGFASSWRGRGHDVLGYRIGRDGVAFTVRGGEERFIALSRLREVGRQSRVEIAGGPPLTLDRGVEIRALRALIAALRALREGRFEGIDTQPPSAASISRVTGNEATADERGISLALSEDE